jgi:hypothetical protein
MANILIEAVGTDAYKNFINTLDSEVSKENYRFAFSKFMKFCRLEEGDYDKMLRIEPKKLEGLIRDYITHLKVDQKLAYNSVYVRCLNITFLSNERCNFELEETIQV